MCLIGPLFDKLPSTAEAAGSSQGEAILDPAAAPLSPAQRQPSCCVLLSPLLLAQQIRPSPALIIPGSSPT